MELLAAIRTLADSDALLAPGITRRLIREFASLHISSATAKTHVSRLFMTGRTRPGPARDDRLRDQARHP